MNYAVIKKTDVANGPGIRVSLFVSGCHHGCKGCFNKEAWSFQYGKPYTENTQKEILEALKPSYIRGLSLLGGEPFEPENRETVLSLVREVRRLYPGKDIWCYTGYEFDRELFSFAAEGQENVEELLREIDVLVDGRFVEEKKDLKLAFRGSKNQRIIDVPRSLEQNKVCELQY